MYGSYSAHSRPDNIGQTAKLDGTATSRLNQWFNTGVFKQSVPYTFGAAPRTVPDARWHGTNNIDLGIFKNNRFGPDGRYNLQFRGEFFNAANRVKFGVAGMSFGTSNFGVVSSQSNIPRQIQLALNFFF